MNLLALKKTKIGIEWDLSKTLLFISSQILQHKWGSEIFQILLSPSEDHRHFQAFQMLVILPKKTQLVFQYFQKSLQISFKKEQKKNRWVRDSSCCPQSGHRGSTKIPLHNRTSLVGK